MSQPIRGQDGHLCFPICMKNTNSIEEVEVLLPDEFRIAVSEKSKCFSQSDASAAILVFLSVRIT